MKEQYGMRAPEPIPGGKLPPDIKALHGRLSSAAAEFLDFAERVPEAFARHSFAPSEASPLFPYQLHAWPLFIDATAVLAMREMATKLCRLIKCAPRRLLGDAASAAAWYGLSQERASEALDCLARTDDARGAISRGDFIHDGTALKCLEFNLTAGVGGWETAFLVQQVMSQPAMHRFATEKGLRVRQPHTLRVFFANIVDCVRRDTEWEGECNIAILFPPSGLPGPALAEQACRLFTSQLMEILRPEGARGEVFMTTYGAVKSAEGHRLTTQGKRLHAVVEYEARDRLLMAGPEFIENARAATAARSISLFNGPAQDVLDDKRNLALLSERVTSSALSAEEQALVRTHVPWSRRVERAHVERGGERVFLPELLSTRREELVLKAGRDFGGASVLLGESTPAPVWDEAARKALDEGGWVVQERVRSAPFHYLGPDGGVLPHSVIWGLFVLGETYGGHSLRLCPMGKGTGVVNVSQGAMFAALIDLE
ncbi:hypothetical protein [Myxococcus sp. CA051A]|uniref:hypothetical protein n=1 Tax=Myxococcus sp. CA051A TaxID=2741739 RepID=UPI0020C5D84B|nr:hypothetical protein [Myxococcus sp. CA051A]